MLLAQRILCDLKKDEFISCIAEISSLVWSSDELALETLITEKTLSEEATLTLISKNEDTREELEAYMGSTFSYEGELYWGVDRLDHLENRLKDLGLKRNEDSNYISERKRTNTSDIPNHSNIELELSLIHI